MPTECSPTLFEFARVEGRAVVASFDGGRITSDAGALLLGATDRVIGLTPPVGRAASPMDAIAAFVEHAVETLVMQRVVGIALGYEDLIDHDELRHDPVMAVLAGKLAARRADCAPLAGKSTLNRLELSRPDPTRYAKLAANTGAIETLFVDLFLDAHDKAPAQITLDLDATDDPLHGHQEGRFFHGYYDCYCYLPLYVFCGRHLLAAKLRRSNIDAAAGSVEEIARIVRRIRARWPRVRILLRGDGGFARESADGMVRGQPCRLPVRAGAQRAPGRRDCRARCRTRAPTRRRPASRPAASATSPGRRWTAGAAPAASSARRSGPAARPIRALSSPRSSPRKLRREHLYETIYCARGEMENRIKECQLDLFADRTSAATMRANQLRLWFASAAYVLLCALRRIGLAHTQFAAATCGTIRLKLLKIGALVRISVRRISVAMASACPWQHEFALAHAMLRTDLA